MTADLAFRQVIDDYVVELVSIDAPSSFINADIPAVLLSDPLLMKSTQLNFAPGLSEALSAPGPPPLKFFKKLPLPDGKFWGIYAVTLTKKGCKSKLCIGSGTKALSPHYRARTVHYSDKKHAALPKLVREAFDDGYELAHIGLLCWGPVPAVQDVPRVRTLYIALEGVFTHIFYSSIPAKTDELLVGLSPWGREEVNWEPANSHSPLVEKILDLELTPTQLLVRDAQRQARYVQRQRQAAQKDTALNNRVQKEWRAEVERQMVKLQKENPTTAPRVVRAPEERTALQQKQYEQSMNWRRANRDKARAIDERKRARAHAERRHLCKPCDQTFNNNYKLQKHLRSNIHAQEMARRAGVVKPPPTLRHQRAKDHAAKTKAEKRFYCALCEVSGHCQSVLDRHNKSKGHLKKVAAAEAALAEAALK